MKTTLFYHFPRLTLLVLVFIFSVGYLGLVTMPMQEDPVLLERWIRINSTFPGADAQQVAAQISEPLEEALSEFDEVKDMLSISRRGGATLSITLKDHVTDVDNAWARILDKAAAVAEQFPEGVLPLEHKRITTTSITLLIALNWSADNDSRIMPEMLQRYALDLKQRLLRLPTTQEASIFGAPREEIQVEVDLLKLQSLGLTLEQLAQAIKRYDVRTPAGTLHGESDRMLIELTGPHGSVNEIKAIPVRKGDNSAIISVGDIATVTQQVKTPADSIALINGRQAIVVGARMVKDSRVNLWAAQAHEILAEYQDMLPQGIEAEVIFDQNVFTEKRFKSLSDSFLSAIILVTLMLTLIMGWRSGLLVGLMLPLTVSLSLAIQKTLGLSLHQISISGMILATGLLIDNGIIVVHRYHHYRLSNLPIAATIDKTVRYLWLPLLISTLTTTLIFMPIILSQGPSGEFAHGIGSSVIISVSTSFVLSLTLLPAIAGFADGLWQRQAQHNDKPHGFSMPRIAAYYRKILQKIFHYPLFYSILFITPCLLGLYAGTQLITQFFPAVDYHQFQVKVQLPSSAGLDETRRQVQQVRKLIHEYPAVKSSHWFIGDNPPRVFYNEVTNRRGESNYAEGFVVMESHADVVKLLPELQTRLRDTFTQAMVLASPYIQGPTIYAPLEIKIKGENIGTLHQLGNQIRLLLSQSKNVIYSVASMSSGQAKLHLDLAGTSAIMAGTDPQQLNRQLRHRLQGLEGGAVLTFRNDIPVRIQTTADDRRNLHKMLGLPMRSGPLSAPGEFPFQDGLSLNGHAKISLVPETEAIVRDYMINTNLILAYITPYTLPDVALNDFKQRLAQSDIHLPAGYAIEFGGESKSRNESQQQLLSTLVPLLLIMVSIIVLSFNSFRMASIILLVAFLSIGAGTAALYIFSYPLSFFSVLGLMGLMGIAINDSIVILIALLRHANSGQCVSVDSATEVVVEETRHIIATTLTSIAGFIPLILWGASSYPPLAIAMAGGVIGATLLALFLVPCLFILLRKTVRNNNATPA